MLKIDNGLLEELGLSSLPTGEKNSLLKHIYETLEMRVGMRLADQMSNEQLDEFEQYFEAKDDAGAFKWLETNFPNYKEIVQQEFDKLKSEVGQSAPQIVAASQQAAAQAPQQPQPPAYPQQPMQGPNTQAPEASAPGVPPSTTPAPAEPYAAPPQPQAQPQYPEPPQTTTQWPPADQQPPAQPPAAA